MHQLNISVVPTTSVSTSLSSVMVTTIALMPPMNRTVYISSDVLKDQSPVLQATNVSIPATCVMVTKTAMMATMNKIAPNASAVLSMRSNAPTRPSVFLSSGSVMVKMIVMIGLTKTDRNVFTKRTKPPPPQHDRVEMALFPVVPANA